MMKYLVINFKTYSETSGENAERMAKIVAKAQQDTDVKLIICVQSADIFRVRENHPHLTIWSQHIDPIEPGRNTGWTSPETLVMAGANGTLINHSEHQLELETIVEDIQSAVEHKLFSCVAVADQKIGKKVVEFKPDMISYEIPELVSGDTSLLSLSPEQAQEFLNGVGNDIPVLIGAGVKNPEDVKTALAYGYCGVMLASGFAKASNPAQFLADILEGFAS